MILYAGFVPWFWLQHNCKQAYRIRLQPYLWKEFTAQSYRKNKVHGLRYHCGPCVPLPCPGTTASSFPLPFWEAKLDGFFLFLTFHSSIIGTIPRISRKCDWAQRQTVATGPPSRKYHTLHSKIHPTLMSRCPVWLVTLVGQLHWIEGPPAWLGKWTPGCF